MFHLIILGMTLAFICLYHFWLRKRVEDDSKILKVLGILLFVSHCATLFYTWEFDNAYKLEGVFSPFGLISMLFLKWFTTIAVGVGIFSTWFKTRTLEKISKTLVPLMAVLNLVFINQTFVAIYGQTNDCWTKYPTYGFLFQISFLLMIGILWVKQMIIEKDYKFTKREVLNYVLVILSLMVAFFPQGALRLFFGDYGEKTKGFTLIHRMCIYANVAYFAIPLLVLQIISAKNQLTRLINRK